MSPHAFFNIAAVMALWIVSLLSVASVASSHTLAIEPSADQINVDVDLQRLSSVVRRYGYYPRNGRYPPSHGDARPNRRGRRVPVPSKTAPASVVDTAAPVQPKKADIAEQRARREADRRASAADALARRKKQDAITRHARKQAIHDRQRRIADRRSAEASAAEIHNRAAANARARDATARAQRRAARDAAAARARQDNADRDARRRASLAQKRRFVESISSSDEHPVTPINPRAIHHRHSRHRHPRPHHAPPTDHPW